MVNNRRVKLVEEGPHGFDSSAHSSRPTLCARRRWRGARPRTPARPRPAAAAIFPAAQPRPWPQAGWRQPPPGRGSTLPAGSAAAGCHPAGLGPAGSCRGRARGGATPRSTWGRPQHQDGRAALPCPGPAGTQARTAPLRLWRGSRSPSRRPGPPRLRPGTGGGERPRRVEPPQGPAHHARGRVRPPPGAVGEPLRVRARPATSEHGCVTA